MALTRSQRQFRDLLASRTGLDRSVVGAWMLAEESGGAAQARERQGNQNWLNIGYFDSGPGAITKSKAFRDPQSAAEATAQFLRGEKFGASPGIRKILSARGHSPQAQVQAIASSGWATNPQYGRNISRLLGPGGQGGGGGNAPVASAASVPTTTNLPGATFKTTVPTVDQSGFEQARRNAIIGQLIARRNPNSILLRSGLLSTTEPSLSEFMGQQTTTSRVPGRTVTSTRVATPGQSAVQGGGGRGASAAINWAVSKVGAPGSQETGGPNQGPLASFLNKRFGMSGQPWCAMFTSAAVTKGGAPMSARTASVAEVRRKAQVGEGYQRGFVNPAQAHPGDLILFGNAHIGMVKGVSGGQIHYVGGNQSNGVHEAVASSRGATIVRPKYGAR